MTAYIYFIQPGEDDAVKIGCTAQNLDQRIKDLQTANHRKLKLIGCIDIQRELGVICRNRVEYLEAARKKEAEIHSRFKTELIHGEWFSLSQRLLDFIQNIQMSSSGQ